MLKVKMRSIPPPPVDYGQTVPVPPPSPLLYLTFYGFNRIVGIMITESEESLRLLCRLSSVLFRFLKVLRLTQCRCGFQYVD